MSEEVMAADSLLTELAELRGRILEWEDAYDRLHGAFDLHMDILECKQALSDYAGVFYDVVLGESLLRAERAELQIKAWMTIGARGQGVVDAVRAYRAAVTTLNGISAAEARLWAALDYYEAAEKARGDDRTEI